GRDMATDLRTMRWRTTTGGRGTRGVELDGGADLKVPFTATFWDDTVELVVTTDAADGRPMCTKYTVRRAAGGPLGLMTTEVMRGVKLRDLLAMSCARVVMETNRPTAVNLEAIEAVTGLTRRRRAPTSDDVLRDVAASYKKNFVPGHMREFAESQGYSERQMW